MAHDVTFVPADYFCSRASYFTIMKEMSSKNGMYTHGTDPDEQRRLSKLNNLSR